MPHSAGSSLQVRRKRVSAWPTGNRRPAAVGRSGPITYPRTQFHGSRAVFPARMLIFRGETGGSGGPSHQHVVPGHGRQGLSAAGGVERRRLRAGAAGRRTGPDGRPGPPAAAAHGRAVRDPARRPRRGRAGRGRVHQMVPAQPLVGLPLPRGGRPRREPRGRALGGHPVRLGDGGAERGVRARRVPLPPGGALVGRRRVQRRPAPPRPRRDLARRTFRTGSQGGNGPILRGHAAPAPPCRGPPDHQPGQGPPRRSRPHPQRRLGLLLRQGPLGRDRPVPTARPLRQVHQRPAEGPLPEADLATAPGRPPGRRRGVGPPVPDHPDHPVTPTAMARAVRGPRRR